MFRKKVPIFKMLCAEMPHFPKKCDIIVVEQMFKERRSMRVLEKVLEEIGKFLRKTEKFVFKLGVIFSAGKPLGGRVFGGYGRGRKTVRKEGA